MVGKPKSAFSAFLSHYCELTGQMKRLDVWNRRGEEGGHLKRISGFDC